MNDPSIGRAGVVRLKSFRRCASLLCVAALWGLDRPVFGLPVDSEWAAPVDGAWTDGANWTTAPDPPVNGAPNADDEYNASILATGASYTVSLDEGVSVSSLTIDSPDATLTLGGVRLETPTINLNAGVLLLGVDEFGFTAIDAEIAGATIIGDGSLVISSQRSERAILDGVSLGVDLSVPTIGGSPPRPRLIVRNGLDLQAGSVLSIERRDALVDVEGTQTFSGGGEIRFDDPSSFTRSGTLRLSEGATLTIGPDLAVRAATMGGSIGGVGNTGQSAADLTLINNGLLSGEADGQPLQLLNAASSANGVFQNNGVVQAIGDGVVTVGGDWTNSGVLRVRDNAQLWLAGVFTPSDIGTIDRQGGRVMLAGRVENTGATLTASAATGDLELGSSGQFFSAVPGRVVGGVINATDGAALILSRGTLENVTLASDARGSAEVAGDLTLQDAVISLSSSDSLSTNSVLRFMDGSPSQALLGSGTIRFTGGRNNTITGNREVTIGPDVVVETTNGDGGLRGQRFVNQGRLSVGSGTSFEVDAGEFLNRGLLEVVGRAIIGRREDARWRNEGAIVIRPGGSLTLGGTFTVDDLGSLVDEGANRVELSGTLDNTGRTLDLESLGLTASLQINGGEIRGGVVTSSGDAELAFVNGGVLNGVTLATDVTIPGFSGRVFVENGLTLDNVTLTMPEGADLLFSAPGPQFLDGVGTIALPNREATSAITTISGLELVIGDGIVIDAGDERFREIELIFGENRGTILADSPGTEVTIGISSGSQAQTHRWRNNGLIVVDGSELSFNGVYTIDDVGEVEFLSGEVVLRGTLDNEGRAVRLDASTGPWKLRGTVNGGRIETADSVVADWRGSANGVTLAGEATIFDNLGSSADGFLRVRDRLTLDGGRLVIDDNAELSISEEDVVIDGVGEILLNGAAPERARVQLFTNSRLTIGEGVTVRTGPDGGGTISRGDLPVTNEGAIVADTPGQTLVISGDFQSTGTLRAANRAELRLSSDEFLNQGRLEIDRGVVITDASRFANAVDGEIVVRGSARIESTATEVLLNAGSIALVEGSNLRPDGWDQLRNNDTGVISGSGVLGLRNGFALINEGTLAPGASTAGALRFLGDTTLGAGGSIEIDLGGVSPDEHDRLQFAGDVVLAGALDVALIGDFALGLSDRFLVIDIVGTATGQFEGLSEGGIVGVFNGVPLFLSYTGGDGNDIVLFTIPEPASAGLAVATLLAAAAAVRRDARLGQGG